MLIRRLWLFAILAGALLPLPQIAARAGTPESPTAVSPTDSVIKLFNGQDLGGLKTWLRDSGHEDPRDVFRVHEGLLHISGEKLGYVITEQEYRDYHLVIEFKWGRRTWANRKDRARDSGVLFHCHGPDGSYGGTWVPSVEAQIIEGGVGDILVLSGEDTHDGTPLPTALQAEFGKDRDGEAVWKKGGEAKRFTGGRINWFGRDPDWQDVVGFRGESDVESPFGLWTRMDVICEGDHVAIEVNGVKVNEAFDASPASGRILVQSELAEIFVRRWELWPLGEAPEFNPATFSFAE